jgi:hypothetical protein
MRLMVLSMAVLTSSAPKTIILLKIKRARSAVVTGTHAATTKAMIIRMTSRRKAASLIQAARSPWREYPKAR